MTHIDIGILDGLRPTCQTVASNNGFRLMYLIRPFKNSSKIMIFDLFLSDFSDVLSVISI